MTALSQKLADLSVRTKTAEDRIAKAQTETHERIEQQRDKVRAEAELALGKVSKRFEEGKAENHTRFQALRAKVDADIDNLKQNASHTGDKFKAWQSDNAASDRETDAIAAIDYAVAAVTIAEFQTLDAIAARSRADNKLEQSQPAPTMA